MYCVVSLAIDDTERWINNLGLSFYRAACNADAV